MRRATGIGLATGAAVTAVALRVLASHNVMAALAALAVGVLAGAAIVALSVATKAKRDRQDLF